MPWTDELQRAGVGWEEINQGEQEKPHIIDKESQAVT